jgi:anti-sigma-K factor RskA
LIVWKDKVVLKHDRLDNELQETAALYALGALSQHEARAFDLHLKEGCEICSAELTEFEEVVGVLGTAAPYVSPPAYLRDLLTLRIEREAARPRYVKGSVIPFPEKAHAVRQLMGRIPGKTLLPWAAAAILLIAFAYAFIGWRSERQSMLAILDQERSQRYKSTDENANLKEQLTKETELSTELAQINAVLSVPQSRIISLTGQGPAPEATAKVYWDVRGHRWVVSANLPPAPQGKIYQLWFVTSAAKVSAGLIKPDKSGHGFTVLTFPPDLYGVRKTAITLEPDGGSAQPTSAIYALGDVS